VVKVLEKLLWVYHCRNAFRYSRNSKFVSFRLRGGSEVYSVVNRAGRRIGCGRNGKFVLEI